MKYFDECWDKRQEWHMRFLTNPSIKMLILSIRQFNNYKNKIHKIVMKHLIFHFKVYQVVVTRSILRFNLNAKHSCWYYTKLNSTVVSLRSFLTLKR